MHSRWCVMLLAELAALPALAQTAPDPAAGHALFNTWCVGCHRATVVNHDVPGSVVNSVVAGTYTLEQRYHGSKPAALEQRTDLTPAYIRDVVRQGLNVMPRTRKAELTDAELNDIVAYLTRNNPVAPGRPR